MNSTRRGPIASFFVGLWDVMNFTRRLIVNFVFFGLLILFSLLFIGAVIGGNARPILLPRTTLVIAPQATLVEQYTSDPLSRAFNKSMGGRNEELQLRDVLRALDAAQRDKNIERVLLHVDDLQGGGMASLREVAAAIARLKASGKQVVAFSEQMDQKQYLLAAQANEVYLDPMGQLTLEGLARYRQYFREGLQDKLGVDVHLFKVGTYKSAAEPYVLDAASPASKEADLFWMNDVWQRYLGDIAKARKLDVATLTNDVNNLPQGVASVQGDLAQLALNQHLVDGLKTRQQVWDLMRERGEADDDATGGFRRIDLDDYIAHLDKGLEGVVPEKHVAVVVAEGEITGGDAPPGKVGGDSASELLRQAHDDDNVAAVVLRVNSPGGEVFASEQIRREVERLKKDGKPVVVSMGDVAASGGYWISMNADRIYADPSTITGSIGIFGVIPTFSRALEKIGVHTDGVGTSPYAGAFDLTRPLDPQVGTVIQTVIEKGYRDFTGRVAKARGRTVEQIDAIAQGRVWSGAQGKERGIVDAMGGLQDALDDAAARAKLGKRGEYDVRYIEKIPTPFEKFFPGLAQSRIGMGMLRESDMARALLVKTAPQAARDLQFLEASANDRRGAPVKAVAYCFCGL
ncbi:signal peptide peptidase SppA [Lysobacter sp. TY2-98]|uniref:signal peptide peptidase SppA n=1 Tax=Lysobacter sp. TY2-98 TaxID=2290922 RepID=UPI000E205865|nr:signal peptide peptidase SppA [Lysobacter sp. TY2-98]AXK73389.1 signal peptide peptidase SppA [Lysobacter sp. TY2-98]